MYFPDSYTADGSNCLTVYDSTPGQTILDLLSRKPFTINIHCKTGAVIYGQIIDLNNQQQRIAIQLANNAGNSVLLMSSVRYIRRPLPIRPLGQLSIGHHEQTRYAILLTDNTEISGVARHIFRNKDG